MTSSLPTLPTVPIAPHGDYRIRSPLPTTL